METEQNAGTGTPEATEADVAKADELVGAVKKAKTHQRAGITTNKGHGQGKTRRQMAAKSRRINRRK